MKQKTLFGLIFLLTVGLRFYHLSQNPLSLFSDEADAGYQAYIFNQCNTDYHGRSWPIHFKSFSDFRTPLYIHSIALFQRFLGPSPITTRLPAVFFGLIATFFFYLIIKKEFQNQWLALLGLVLFTINPWLLHYSNTGFEVSGMLACILIAVYFFQIKKFTLFLIFLLISPYFYSTAKLFVFFILLFALPTLKKNISLKKLFHLIIPITLLCLPLVIDTFKGNAGYRFSYINIFSDPTVSQQVDYRRFQDAITDHPGQIGLQTGLASKLIHNKITQWASKFTRNYYSAFSTQFLFLSADSNLRHGFQGKGYLLYPDLFLIPLGLIYLFSHRRSQTSLLFFFVLLTSPIPFSLTRDSIGPHGTRLILMAPALIYLSLLGLHSIWSKTKIVILVLFIYLLTFIDFSHFYHYHYPILSARAWHTGIKEAINQSANSSYPKIYYSSKYEPFVPFFLYYQQYLPPKNCDLSQSLIWDNNEFFTGRQIDNKYYFGHIEWSQLYNHSQALDQSLFVVPKDDLSQIQSSSLQIKTKKEIPPQYDTQETFYLITFNET